MHLHMSIGCESWICIILEIRVMQLLRYLGLGTWEREVLELRVMQSGLRYLGLGTWEREILKFNVMHLLRKRGLGTANVNPGIRGKAIA